MTGGMCPGVEGPAAYGDGCCRGGACCGSGIGIPIPCGLNGCDMALPIPCGLNGCGMALPIPCWLNGCAIALAADANDGTGNWSPCRRLKSPRRSLRGRTLLYVVGWGWGWGIETLVPPRPQELNCALGSWVRRGRKGVLVRTSFGGRGRGLRCRGYSAES
jgi:hypothetical protein